MYFYKHTLFLGIYWILQLILLLFNATGSLTIDIISTLSSNFSYLRGASIRCGRDMIFSNSAIVEGYGKLSTLDKYCSLLSNVNASFCLAIIELTCIGRCVPIIMNWLIKGP